MLVLAGGFLRKPVLHINMAKCAKYESMSWGILFGILAFWFVERAVNGFVSSFCYYYLYNQSHAVFISDGVRLTGVRIFSPIAIDLVVAVAISWLALKLWRKQGPFQFGRWLLLTGVVVYLLGYGVLLGRGYFDPLTIIPWGPRPQNTLDQIYWPLEQLRHQVLLLLHHPRSVWYK
jgi:hypothetical protein